MKPLFRILGISIILAALLALGLFFFNAETKNAAPKVTTPENWYDDLIFEDKSFVFEFVRAMGYSYSGGADTGECVQTARRIKDGDIHSWYAEWLKTADRLYGFAQKLEKEGNVVSAREAYFRASNYYRVAGFYMHAEANRPESLTSWQKSRESFLKAISTLPNIEPIKIPYENTTLPGYFITTPNPLNSAKSPPLLIVHTGFDGTGEELYFEIGLACIKRGYNCLIFEGPGQGEVIRIQKLPYRYDWEKVVTPVVDYALKRPDVDKDNIALMGISMGGYFAPRAAAFDKRIKACIANGGVFDVTENMLKAFPAQFKELMNTDPEKFNAIMEKEMQQDTTTKWFFENGMWTFDAKSAAELLLKMEKYSLKDVAKNINCNMLVIDSEDDMFFKGQPKKLFDELTCPKDYVLFTREETAQAHCQVGATAVSNEIIFNWLDKVFLDSFDTETQRRLEQVVETNLAECQGVKDIPGVVIGIWVPGRGRWVKAVGKSDIAKAEDIKLNDKFRIGSNTKTFVVTVLLQLADEGKLSLDDTLDKFSLGLGMPYENKITLRQLCNMTSGIPEFGENKELDETFYVKNPLKKWTPEEIVKAALVNPSTFSPGEGWYYTNTGYILLGMIIEKISGNKIEDEVQKRILDPMNLTSTSFPVSFAGMPCPYAHGYELDDNKNWQDVTVYSPSLLWSAGAMISDMYDMKAWVKAYTTGTTNSKATQKERLTWVDTHKGKNLTFGLGIGNTNGWLGYTGGTRGFNTAAYYLPSKDATIIVFINTTDYSKDNVSVANKIVHDLTQILFPDHVAW
ncbi:MAG: serine hydrolase [Candidatus Omnitrophica bacterium]|nr:serine hydrolase [Candidatus Omnitrophota bacterium]